MIKQMSKIVRERQVAKEGKPRRRGHKNLLAESLGAGALRLDVTRLLALVANLLAAARVLGAVTREMPSLATVVTFASVHTVPGHVADTAARIARLVLVEPTTAAAVAARVISSAERVATFGAITGNMADFAALVALGAGLTAITTAGSGSGLRAITRDMAGLTTSIACFGIFRPFRAVTAHMSLTTTVVALGLATVRAIAGLMGVLAAREARTSLRVEVHGLIGTQIC